MSDILENANLQEENSSVGNKTAVVAIIGRPSVGKSTFLCEENLMSNCQF